MQNRFKSDLPEAKPLYEKDNAAGKMIAEILAKYPEHKRVLYLKTKFENNEPLTATDKTDLDRFHKIATKV